MEMKIGEKLVRLRREKGLTQEQLADLLGVSAPAVSKWETDRSYPDITLLCPLARALGTNVDTLLQFEENLPDEAVTEKVNEILETARVQGCEAGEKRMRELLHRYPNSVALKFNAAVVWDSFRILYPTADEETQKAWAAGKKQLLTEVRASGTAAYWQVATLQLAGIALSEGDPDRAEQLLSELPEIVTDPTLIRSLLALKKENAEEAQKILQKRLYTLVRETETCLTMLMDSRIAPDPAQAFAVCEVYRDVDRLFGLGGWYEGPFLEIYLRMDRLEEAADCLDRYVDAMLGEAVLPKTFLFGTVVKGKEHQPASTVFLRRMFLQGLEDDTCRALREHPKGKAAIARLRESCWEEGM